MQEFLGAGPPDARCGTRHHSHRPSQVGGRSPTAKLGLLQVPVLDVEQFMVWEGLVATKVVLGAAQHGDGVVVDVGGDSGVSGRPPDGEHSEFRVKDHPGGRVDLGQFSAGPFPVLFYVLPVGLGVSLKDLSGGADHGDALGADHMVGSKWALAGQRGQVGSGQEFRHRRVGMAAHHHGFPGHPG